jgi:hypothetical protein
MFIAHTLGIILGINLILLIHVVVFIYAPLFIQKALDCNLGTDYGYLDWASVSSFFVPSGKCYE